MATLSCVLETSMARNNAKNIALQLGALWRCNSQQRCCVAATHVAAVLQAATLWRCGVATHNNAATRNVVVLRVAAALQLALLRRYSSRCYGATARIVAMLRQLPMLQAATPRHCGAIAARGVAVLWRYNSSRCCDAATLQLRLLRHCVWPRHCDIAHGRDIAALRVAATLRHCAWPRRCGVVRGVVVVVFFFF